MHGVDAMASYRATSTSPFVTLKVAVYQPVDRDDVPSATELCGFVKEQVLRFGAGTADMRIVRVPFDVHHPVWVADPDYSPDDHIYRTALPAPGDKAQFCAFLSDLMGRPLDPDRPLWEAWIVEGLEGGRVAVAVKMHHVLADGGTIATVLERSHSETAEDDLPLAGDRGEPIPGRARLLAGALADLVTSCTDELPGFYRERRLAREERAARDVTEARPDVADERPGPAPFTVLNEKGGGRYRVYRYETFSLAEFKALSRAYGCTVNTLVLGLCSEALKRYLADVDAVPSTSLLAAMPMGHPGRPPRRTRLHPTLPRNDVAVAILPLHQDVDDFAQRLQAIKRSSTAAIHRVQQSWGSRFDNYLEFLPGALVRQVNRVMGRQQAKRKGAYANVVVSNVAGPRRSLFAMDGRLELVDFFSTGNITDLGHLNITVWSYVDHLTFSFFMRKGGLPQPEKIPAYLREVFDELKPLLTTFPFGEPDPTPEPVPVRARP
jgi:WS/DGAT/MGAT family acyltransferase